MTNAIEVENLTKYYGRPESGVLAVDHVNFEVRQGEVFGFLGPNGAGKTTAQRMLTTLLRWGLLFISGVFIGLNEMAPAAQAVAYLSPLTYAQDLMNHAVLGAGLLDPWLDLGVLLLTGVLFLVPSMMLHRRGRKLGY